MAAYLRELECRLHLGGIVHNLHHSITQQYSVPVLFLSISISLLSVTRLPVPLLHLTAQSLLDYTCVCDVPYLGIELPALLDEALLLLVRLLEGPAIHIHICIYQHQGSGGFHGPF